MKNIGIVLTLALCLAAAKPASAQSSDGTLRFLLEDAVPQYLDFAAATDERGGTAGQMTYLDPTRIPDTDDPEDPRAEAPPELYVKAELNRLTADKNQALMGGTILDSSHKTFIGKWVQLVVEDNGRNAEIPDRLTWSICDPKPGGWVPSDAERKDDDGAYLRWWATDAERKDDVGIPSTDLLAKDEGCQVYALGQYPWADVLKADGDINVRP